MFYCYYATIMVNKDLQNMKIDSGMVIVLEDFQFAWNKKEKR